MSRRHLPPLTPETSAIHGFYDPQRSEGAVVPPIFATTTFAAPSAEALEAGFKQAYGLGQPPCNPDLLIYTRLVNPNTEILERRLAVFEEADEAAVFASGMAAIFTTINTFVRPGDTVFYSEPIYGGTHFLLSHSLPEWGVQTVPFPIDASSDDMQRLFAKYPNVKLVLCESPSNPTLLLADIPELARQTHEANAILVVDNTVLGPVFQKPLLMGADLTVYSATKIIGGHSHVIAGLTMGRAELITTVKGSRTIMGTIKDPLGAWQLLISLQTLGIRARAMAKNARSVADFLRKHEKVSSVLFPGFSADPEQQRRFKEQCTGSGSLLSFHIRGGKPSAYRFLNTLRLIQLAVSLGGVESLAEHPASHTHSDVSLEDQERFGIAPDLVRLSVGLENIRDIKRDLSQALRMA